MPPSRLVPGLPRDVETIALKCLQKEPEKRYDSAAALAEDLRRFLGGEPIVARPVPFWERAWRWCRRHPAPAALTAAVVLVAALGLAGILWQWGEAVKARDLASKRAVAEAEAQPARAETTLVDMYTTSGISAGDQGEHARAALWFANAARRAEGRPRPPARQRGPRPDLGPPGVHAAPRRRRRRIMARGPRLPSGRPLPDHEDRDRRQDQGCQQHALGPGRPSDPLPFPGGLTAVPAAAWSPDGSALAVGPQRGRCGRRPLPRRRGGDPHPVPGAHPAPDLQRRRALPGDRRREARPGLGCPVAHVRHPGAGASRGGDDAGVPPRGPVSGDRVPG